MGYPGIKTTLSVVHDKEVLADIEGLILQPIDQKPKAINAMMALLSALGSGIRNGSIAATVDSNDAVAATGTLTVASGAANDTAVVGPTTFTCVDHRETTNVTFAADVAGSLNNTYFTFQSQDGAHKYYVWFNINSAGTDPAVTGRTGLAVAGATGASAATLATAAVAACAALSGVTVTAGNSGHIIITDNSAGVATAVADGAAATSFTFTRSITGSTVSSTQYELDLTDTLTAANLAAAIQAHASMAGVVTAAAAAGVVTVTSSTLGLVGNAIKLAATANVTASGATLGSGTALTSVSATSTFKFGV